MWRLVFIRAAERLLQGSINPMLSNVGERSEASQYSGRRVAGDWKCPFHAKAQKSPEEPCAAIGSSDGPLWPSIYLTTGHVLFSNRSRPLLTITADTVGRHDFLFTPCSPEMFRVLYRVNGHHPSCFENLVGRVVEQSRAQADRLRAVAAVARLIRNRRSRSVAGRASRYSLTQTSSSDAARPSHERRTAPARGPDLKAD
jgi:hypothetical protein